MDNRLELIEMEMWALAQRRADLRARGSRASTATAAGISMTGITLAESSMRYAATYDLVTGNVSSVMGTGMGTTGGTFGTGG